MQDLVRSRELRALQALRVLTLSHHDIRGTLLDLGCGGGWLTNKLGETGAYTIGIDNNKRLIRLAKKCVHDCEFLVAEGRSLPFKNAVFKTVVTNDVLEHISYANGALVMSEAARTLTGDGKIYASVMNRWQILEPHLLVPFMTWLPRQMWDTLYRFKLGEHTAIKYTEAYFPYTKRQLRWLIHHAGLEDEDYTWLYATDKISNPEQIGSPVLRIAVKLIKTIKLDKLAIILAEKVSVLVFICHKR